MNLLSGLLLAVLVAAVAFRLHSLSRSGALAAAILGTVIFGLGGLGWAILLLSFFISSSALSRLFKRRKASLDEKFSKGSQRDAAQVLANGGIAGLCVLLHLLLPGSGLPAGIAWTAFAGSLAAANADTWATELGVLSRSAPRLITTGRVVERGTSGGVSITGTLAALVGSVLVGLLAVIFWQGYVFTPPASLPAWWRILAGADAVHLTFSQSWLPCIGIALAGFLGSLFDSFLGATVQASYYCPSCKKETERHPTHTCGSQTVLRRGWCWLNNDWVNTFCTLLGALLAALAGLTTF